MNNEETKNRTVAITETEYGKVQALAKDSNLSPKAWMEEVIHHAVRQGMTFEAVLTVQSKTEP